MPIPDADSGELWSVLEQRISLLRKDGSGSRGWKSWARGREAWNSLGSGSPTELWASEDTAVFLRYQASTTLLESKILATRGPPRKQMVY